MAASAAAQQAAQAAQAAGQAAEASQQTAQASRQMLEATENLRSDLLRSLIQKPDVFKPETRDSEVEGWLEWRHGMVNYLGTVDPGFVNDLTEVSLAEQLTKFEEVIREYERISGGKYNEDLMFSTLIQACPSALQVTTHETTQPMEVDRVQLKGKKGRACRSKGKGKKGKNKGKVQQVATDMKQQSWVVLFQCLGDLPEALAQACVKLAHLELHGLALSLSTEQLLVK
eukprot:s460_g2.t1